MSGPFLEFEKDDFHSLPRLITTMPSQRDTIQKKGYLPVPILSESLFPVCIVSLKCANGSPPPDQKFVEGKYKIHRLLGELT